MKPIQSESMTMKLFISIAVIPLFIHQTMFGEDSAKGSGSGQQQFASSDSLVASFHLRDSEMDSTESKSVVMHSALATHVLFGSDSTKVLASLRDGDAEPAHPQSLMFRTDLVDESRLAIDSTSVDSLPRPVQRKLLPDNMSFLERGLWGENGLVRGMGIASPLTPEVRKHELAVRRTMLTMHQIGGFLTLGSMITAVYFGQKTLDDVKSGNTSQRNDRNLHQTFVATTLALYGTTAMLSVLSPPPLIRRDEISTTTIHKTLAWVHFGGMIITPILGAVINRRGASYYDQARVHQISAYITTAVFAASMIVITF